MLIDAREVAKFFQEAGVQEARAEALPETLVEVRAAELSQLATNDDLRVGLAELKADMLCWLVPCSPKPALFHSSR